MTTTRDQRRSHTAVAADGDDDEVAHTLQVVLQCRSIRKQPSWVHFMSNSESSSLDRDQGCCTLTKSDVVFELRSRIITVKLQSSYASLVAMPLCSRICATFYWLFQNKTYIGIYTEFTGDFLASMEQLSFWKGKFSAFSRTKFGKRMGAARLPRCPRLHCTAASSPHNRFEINHQGRTDGLIHHLCFWGLWQRAGERARAGKA